jgi:hypothetical protein
LLGSGLEGIATEATNETELAILTGWLNAEGSPDIVETLKKLLNGFPGEVEGISKVE